MAEPEDGAMRVEMTRTLDDLVRLNYTFMSEIPGGKKLRKRFYLSGIVRYFVLLAVIGMVNFFSPRPFFSPRLFVGSFVVIAAVSFPTLKWQFKRSIKKTVAMVAQNQKGWFTPTIVEVSSNGVGVTSEDAESQRSWAGVERVFETPEDIVLYSGGTELLTVPKRFFANEADAREFYEAARKFKEDFV